MAIFKMRKKARKKSKKSEGNKVTPQQFFRLQWKVCKELLSEKKKWTIGIMVFSVVITICSFIEVHFIEYVTDGIYLFYQNKYQLNELVIMFVLFFLLLLFERLLKNQYNVTRTKFDSHISSLIDQKITKKISGVSYEYFESMEFYEKIHLASRASSQYPNAVYGITQIITILSSLVVYSVILARVNLLFVVGSIGSILIAAVISFRTTDRQLDYWRDHVSPAERRNNYFKDLYANRVNQSDIQINNAYGFFSHKFHQNNRATRKNYLKLNAMSLITEIAVSLLFVTFFCVTAITVGDKIVKGELNLGYYSMVVAALSNLFLSIKKFIMFINNESWYVKVLEAYYDVLRFTEADASDPDAAQETPCDIELDHISYTYAQSERKALENIDLQLTHNQKIAIVGANGSGKSTCVLIVLNLLKHYSGILHRHHVIASAILQDYGNYQMTIKQNIEVGVGGEELPDHVIEDLLKKVGLWEFVRSKPQGIYTKLGQLEKGEGLSVGQWQRLAIARLLANEKANVWILDEPTAHLDPLAEIEIYKLIFDLSGERLVIFISHRLGFARMAEKIIVFNEGHIEEVGDHSQLMNRDGLYKKMFDIQKEMYI